MAEKYSNSNSEVPPTNEPKEDPAIFRQALADLFPGQSVDELSTEELRSVLHLAQLRKAALNSTGGAS